MISDYVLLGAALRRTFHLYEDLPDVPAEGPAASDTHSAESEVAEDRNVPAVDLTAVKPKAEPAVAAAPTYSQPMAAEPYSAVLPFR